MSSGALARGVPTLRKHPRRKRTGAISRATTGEYWRAAGRVDRYVLTSQEGRTAISWNKSSGGAYHLAGGGLCIAMVVVPSSPPAGNSARSAASRLSRGQLRHLLVRGALEVLRPQRRRIVSCGGTSSVWQFSG